MEITESSPWGSFALVSYIPDPLGPFFQELRRALPGDESPQPHITILPPRPLTIPVEAASEQAREILVHFRAFEVELSEVRCFPETSVLYLDVGEGSETLYALHAALNANDLKHLEQFDFRPHLTLSGPIPAAGLGAAQQQAEKAWSGSGYASRFLLSELVCLWLSPEGGVGEWQRLWSQGLQPREAAPAASASAATGQRY